MLLAYRNNERAIAKASANNEAAMFIHNSRKKNAPTGKKRETVIICIKTKESPNTLRLLYAHFERKKKKKKINRRVLLTVG